MPIKHVFMLSIDGKLGCDTLRKNCATGHSTVPVYEEVKLPTSGIIEARNKAGSDVATFPSSGGKEADGKTTMVKRITGIFLVKEVVDLVSRPNRHIMTCVDNRRPPSSVLFLTLAVCLSSKREARVSN